MTNQKSDDLFSVVVEVHNAHGNLLFLYYPLAGVIQVKRNKVFSEISIAGLLEKGTKAIKEKGAVPAVTVDE